MLLLFGGIQEPNLLDPSEDLTDTSQYTSINLNILANNTLAPDNRTTADRCEPISANSFLQVNNEAVSINTDYTFSIYLKSTGSDRSISFSIRTTGLVLIGDNESLTVTNSWKRFTIMRNTGANSIIRCLIGGENTWTSGEDIVIWGFQLNKGPLSSYQVTGLRDIAFALLFGDSLNNWSESLDKSLDIA